MAKEWLGSFYRNARWRRTRKEKLRSCGYECHDCNGRATEVHHIIELTPDNIHEDAIAYGFGNLMCLCWDCHNKRTLGKTDVPDGFAFDEDGQMVPYPPC